MKKQNYEDIIMKKAMDIFVQDVIAIIFPIIRDKMTKSEKIISYIRLKILINKYCKDVQSILCIFASMFLKGKNSEEENEELK